MTAAVEILSPEALTIGFARRFAAYKRATLLFRDLDRLEAIVNHADRPVQFIIAGKAHPKDEPGKDLIRTIVGHAREDRFRHRIVYLENYDMEVARYMLQGVDVWLNTPRRPNEASGTSGMKAVVNGGIHMSVLDGWWLEGHIEGVTGWSIGGPGDSSLRSRSRKDASHADALYAKLEELVVPCFYRARERFTEVMRNAIALNGSFFNTQRMVWQYLQHAYGGATTSPAEPTEPEDVVPGSSSPGNH